MCIKKIFICVLSSIFFLGSAGVVIAADFDHSMKLTSDEINAVSSLVSPMDAATNATDVGDSMTFTSEEIDSIGPVNRGVRCTQNC